jgi:type III secretion protein L
VVGYYRLKELGFRLPAGAHVLTADAVAPLDAATALLAEAEARADSIVAQAREEYERQSRQGYEDGLARARVEAVERLLREGAALDAGLAAMEAELGRVVTACVRKLVDTFDDQARAEAVVRGALRQMRRERRFELRVSPPQYTAFKEGIGAITAEFPEIELIDVVEDAALTPPQIVIESSIGRVEAAFGDSLAEFEAVLRGGVAESRAEAEAARA